MQSVLASLLARFGKAASVDREIVLEQRRIFIVPTRAGAVFAVVLLLMLVGSINYGLGLGLALTFLLASFGITAMLHTFRNLAKLRLTPMRAPAVFAGETARFGVCVDNPTRAQRSAIRLTGGPALASSSRLAVPRNGDSPGSSSVTSLPAVGGSKVEADMADVPAESSAVLTVSIATSERGVLRPGRLTLHTTFPVGLYHAWSYLNFDAECIVYPKPAPPGMPLPCSAAPAAAGAHTTMDAEDFAGLRSYQPGDPLRHVAWKAVARGRGLLTKQFRGARASEIWLAPDLVPGHIDIEQKLSQLTRWVLDAHAGGFNFGLRLPHITVNTGHGDRHRDRCLEALAFHPRTRAVAAPGSA